MRNDHHELLFFDEYLEKRALADAREAAAEFRMEHDEEAEDRDLEKVREHPGNAGEL
jgi:hypothetical protein